LCWIIVARSLTRPYRGDVVDPTANEIAAAQLAIDGEIEQRQIALAVLHLIAAERVVRHLERAGFVVMKKPPLGGHSALGRGFEG
jgi:hypothetical protein